VHEVEFKGDVRFVPDGAPRTRVLGVARKLVDKVTAGKDEPERCLMETYLLRPFKGERPKPVPTRWLAEHETHLDAPEMGELARIFYQDEFNINAVQKGLHTLKALNRGTEHGVYQAGKIRHFHRLWDRWVSR